MHLNPINLKGRAALVTGGSSDIGRAVCYALAGAGASVIIHYNKNRESAEKICNDIVSGDGIAAVYGADMSDECSVDSLFRFIKTEFGRLDILVNNVHSLIKRTFLKEISWTEHQEQINVMVKGVFQCSKNAVTMMSEQGKGSIINILTAQTEHPVSGYSSYVTAASALAGFTRSLALEAGEKGIRVNIIAPNFILTSRTPQVPEHVQDAFIKATPLGRLATPEDLAKAALFFASDLSEFITGSYLVIDGGYGLSGRP